HAVIVRLAIFLVVFTLSLIYPLPTNASEVTFELFPVSVFPTKVEFWMRELNCQDFFGTGIFLVLFTSRASSIEITDELAFELIVLTLDVELVTALLIIALAEYEGTSMFELF